jgi:aryl-alcohol dehydrogenase-like predicted oxidoreductase
VSIPRYTLADGYSLSRVIKGGWHLAGGHGSVDRRQALADMAAFVEAGITSFDCADIYTGVEELIGAFRQAYPDLAKRVQVHTKYVPDLSDLATLSAAQVEATIDRSLRRLGVEQLDLVQFHWWDYRVPRSVETALVLDKLRRAGKIARIGVTNFDQPQLSALLAAAVPISAHQLQYSLVDDRPENGMTALCADHGIALLCYGTVLGGFLSERWLGRDAPDDRLDNRSLIKYQLIIEDFGGWPLFQTLLQTLAGIAARYGSDIATIGSKALLDRPGVAAVIVGATNRAHLAAHQRIGDITLDAADLAAIKAVTGQRRGPAGDVYDLERDRDGRHGRIIKYNLNKQ